MPYKFLAIAAMSLSLGATGALAQTTQTDTTTGVGTGAAVTGMQHDRMPMEWKGNIGDAFYSDTELGTLRTDDELRTGWEGLDEDDQATVRDYCERFAMDDDRAGTGADAQVGATTGTAAGTDATTGAATGTGTVGTTTDTGAAVDPAAGAGMHQASLRQICEMIEDDDNT